MHPDELRYELEKLPRYIAVVQHREGQPANPEDRRYPDHEITVISCVRWEDIEKILEYVERESG